MSGRQGRLPGWVIPTGVRSAPTGVPHVEIDIVGRGRRCHRLSRPTMSLSTGRAPARAPTGTARRALRPALLGARHGPAPRTVKSAWDDHFAGRSGAPGLRPTTRAALGQGPRGQHRDREAPSSRTRRRTGRRSPRPVGITHPGGPNPAWPAAHGVRRLGAFGVPTGLGRAPGAVGGLGAPVRCPSGATAPRKVIIPRSSSVPRRPARAPEPRNHADPHRARGRRPA